MNAHIFYTPFTGTGLHGGMRGKAWLTHRIGIFKSYTLKSFLAQTNKDFIWWASFRAEEEYNPEIIKLGQYLADCGLKFIFTFHGLMYFDDKFTNYNLKTRCRNLLMMLWDCWWYKEFRNPLTILKHTWENKNQTLPERLAKSLKILENTLGTQYDWIYLTRIDSDDMFQKDVVELIQDQKPKYNKALVFDKGFIYNTQTGQLAEWNPPTNPPFHTIIFPASVFFDSQEHLKYYGDFKTHEDIRRIFKCEVLDVGKYCVSFHGKQISTAWESPILKKLYHKAKYDTMEPFKGYCYTVSNRNISTRWQSRRKKTKNPMIGEEFKDKDAVLQEFGIF